MLQGFAPLLMKVAEEEDFAAIALVPPLRGLSGVAAGELAGGTREGLARLVPIYLAFGQLSLARKEHEEADECYSLALETSRIALGERNPVTMLSRLGLAAAHNRLGRLEDVEQELVRLIEDCAAAPGQVHLKLAAERLRAMNFLDLSRPREALAIYERILPDLEASHGIDATEVLLAREGLLIAKERQGNCDEQLAQDHCDHVRRVHGAGHSRAVVAARILGTVLWGLEDEPGAEQAFRTALAEAQRRQGECDPITLDANGELAGFFLETGRGDRAVELRREWLRCMRERSDPTRGPMLEADFAAWRARAGDPAALHELRVHYERLVAARESSDEDLRTLRVWLAQASSACGTPEESERCWRAVLADARGSPEDAWDLAFRQLGLARALIALGELDEAEELLERAAATTVATRRDRAAIEAERERIRTLRRR
jgi:tetratricopeptide (TPR) repeat protein